MGDDSDEQLEQRVDQLEQQLSKMLPGRRGVLKGLGAAALGGAAVGGATGGAAGQSAAGQVGTESGPVDVEAASVAAQSVSTDDASIGQLESEKHLHPKFEPYRSQRRAKNYLEISFIPLGIHFEQDASVSWEPQGLAYRDGQLYSAEVTDNGTPSTIHEINRDGSVTGETYQLPSGEGDHVSGLEWRNGHLWACGFNASTIYKIDWENKSLVGQFDYGAGVVTSSQPSCMTFVPTSGGDDKLLILTWDSQDAHLINPDDAVTDGTANGNVYESPSNGFSIHPQGAKWRNGYLYQNHSQSTHSGSFKTEVGFAESIGQDRPLTGVGNEWVKYQDLPANDLQDLAFDTDRGEWFTTDEANSILYSGNEKQAPATPPNWSQWNRVDGGYRSGKALKIDSATYSGGEQLYLTRTFAPPFTGWIQVPLYDDGSGTKQTYAAVSTDVDDRQTLGVNTSKTNGDVNYYRWNATDGWTDTGIARPSSGQWVLLGWQATGNAMRLYISKDRGRTWEPASGDITVEAASAQILTLEAGSGSALIGGATIEPDY